MPSLIDIRRRIRSVKNTQQITKAMKMVSAAKLRRAQDRVLAARPYADILRQLLANVVAAAGSNEQVAEEPLLAKREEKRIQMVLLTADRGLAGAFNATLIKGALRFAQEHDQAQIEYELVGRKGRDAFRRRGAAVSGEYVGMLDKVKYDDASTLARKIIDRFRKQEIDAVYLINNEFKSMMQQRVVITRLLPVETPAGGETVDYIYEQPPGEMVGALLPRYVEVTLYRAMVESVAAEHAARMTAMEAATKNSGEVIERLTLHMNRVRQASITKEIIEIVSGAAALD